ncbi:hypothetical protein CFR72_06390 [Gluconacetobacter entanii]|uniref:Phosphoadenosine phosphosulphate reductase domain-containing protein n=1 Tax=Gluconacetobacter entanii TaxID=108528 RepID=A0A318PTP2_9PROT|nr:hypothetical protein CFR72_06390 [Gluconacetobacter entanii]
MKRASEPQEGQTIAVWFSCGAASAVAAKLAVKRWGNLCNVRVVNTPVLEEDPDNRRFLADVQDWLGVQIEQAVNPRFPHNSARAVWEKRRFMSGPRGAPCTLELKKQARQHWENANPCDWHVLGFTADEQRHHARFTLTERPNVLPVLIDAGLTKAACFGVLKNEGIVLPAIYRRGYPNANCIGCVKATSPTYWNHVRRVDPGVFADRAEQSRRIGCRLVEYRGERIFLDELPPDAMGRPLKSYDHECGLFCEEKEMA